MPLLHLVTVNVPESYQYHINKCKVDCVIQDLIRILDIVWAALGGTWARIDGEGIKIILKYVCTVWYNYE